MHVLLKIRFSSQKPKVASNYRGIDSDEIDLLSLVFCIVNFRLKINIVTNFIEHMYSILFVYVAANYRGKMVLV